MSGAPFNLFALLGRTSDPKVLRVSLAKPLQDEIAELFTAQTTTVRPAGAEEVRFDGRYRPDADQVFVVRGYSPAAALRRAAENPTDCALLRKDELMRAKIRGLMVARHAHNGLDARLQVVQRTQIIRPARFSLLLGRDTFQRLDAPGLCLGERLAAQVFGGALYFRSYAAARRVLDVGGSFRAATDQDLERFFASSHFDAAALGELRRTTDQVIRHKVGMLLRNDLFGRLDPKLVHKRGGQVGIDVRLVSDGRKRARIALPGEKRALKRLLKLLDEDYLQSLFDDERLYETNSKRPVHA